MSDPNFPGESALAKVAARDQHLAGRRRIGVAELGEAARGLAAAVMQSARVRTAATVCCYVSVGSEPGTGPLLDALTAAGKRVLLPVLRPDNDLDWAVYRSPAELVRAGRGLLEPTGERLGVEAVASADVVLVPGVAVSTRGERLGRGGGSYDRALARVTPGTLVAVLLYDAEVVDAVPVEPHDRAVGSAFTPTREIAFS